MLCSANWHESKWCFAELIFAKAMGKEIFPVVVQECSVDQVAADHQAVFVFKEGEAAYQSCATPQIVDTLGLGMISDGHRKTETIVPSLVCRAFNERLAGVYFGREAETQMLLEDLRKMRANGQPRLLMIVGGWGAENHRSSRRGCYHD